MGYIKSLDWGSILGIHGFDLRQRPLERCVMALCDFVSPPILMLRRERPTLTSDSDLLVQTQLVADIIAQPHE